MSTEDGSRLWESGGIEMEAHMFYLYFHCAGPGEILIDRHGAEVLDLIEARDRALSLARALVEKAYGARDFSDWHVYVSDEDDDEMLLIPFSDVMPTLH
ncbi:MULTISPECIES: DUF6894 family protein [Microvirga]|uniref:DUF6894 family protein n=1 Tax=Microvirga TaxID=186650 RepID=UPI0021C82F00|nr:MULTISPECIES: hypothetical protein [unclassified Microvirga]